MMSLMPLPAARLTSETLLGILQRPHFRWRCDAVALAERAVVRYDAGNVVDLSQDSHCSLSGGSLRAFEPWPAEAAPQWRARYHAAAASMGTNPVRAAEMFDTLATEAPSDPVPSCMARRLRSQVADV
jgi:hypothetical protein